MSRVTDACGWILLAAALVYSADPPMTTVILPHAPKAGEAVFLEIKLGDLPRGTKIEFSDSHGRPMGAISPFGRRTGSEAGAYTIPVPASAVSGSRVSPRIVVNDGKQKRVPISGEVRSVAAKLSREERP